MNRAHGRTRNLKTAATVLIFAILPMMAHGDVHLLRKAKVGGDGGWDYVTLDSDAHRLYIARSSHVMVVDSDSLTVVGDIPNTPGVHGVALVPELGRGFTSNGRDTSVTIFDLKTLHPLGVDHVGLRPDAIVFDPASRRVFTMNAGSNDATAIDAASGAVVGSVKLGGRPEAAACDGRGHMYVNLEDSSAVVVVDTRALKAGPRWPLAPGESPTGIAIDARRGILFSGCGNKTLVVMDSRNGHVIATVPIGERVDGVAFDSTSSLAFSSNGEGTLTEVHEESPSRFVSVANIPTALGARTSALDTRAHRVYLVTAEFGPPPPATPDRPKPRPTIVPNSFEILVYGE